MAEEAKNPGETPKPEKKKDEKVPTPLTHLSKSMLDHVAVLANEVKGLVEAKKPVEALQALTRGFDKLAIRCSREAIILADRETASQINPLVQVTAINVAGTLKALARDIEQAPGLPKHWEDLGKALGEQRKLAQAVQEIISQTGVAATVAAPGEPLRDAEGKPLASE